VDRNLKKYKCDICSYGSINMIGHYTWHSTKWRMPGHTNACHANTGHDLTVPRLQLLWLSATMSPRRIFITKPDHLNCLQLILESRQINLQSSFLVNGGTISSRDIIFTISTMSRRVLPLRQYRISSESI
jgi:hypothetical protein